MTGIAQDRTYQNKQLLQQIMQDILSELTFFSWSLNNTTVHFLFKVFYTQQCIYIIYYNIKNLK